MDYLQPRKTLMFRTFRSNGEILCDVTFVFKEANRSLLDEGDVRRNPGKFRRATTGVRFPAIESIRRGFSHTFWPVWSIP